LLHDEEHDLSGDIDAIYEDVIYESKTLMMDKNHDYDEVWRKMRISSLTDIILQKLLRIKQIEDNDGMTNVSEGLKANYQDIINYSIFALIRLTENKKTKNNL
jgi:D-mannonate dehydratase